MGRLVLDTRKFLDGEAAGDPLRDEVPRGRLKGVPDRWRLYQVVTGQA